MLEKRPNRTGLVQELRRIAVPLGILTAGVVAFLILSRKDEVPAVPIAAEEAPLVETVRAEAHDRALDIQVDGVVVPYREVELSAEVDGRVQYKADACRAGSYVRRNTLLLKIDPRDHELECKRLRTEVEQAEGNLEELEADIKNTENLMELAQKQLDLQRADFKRQEELHRKGIASNSELDLAEQTRLQAENAVLTLRSQLQVLSARRSRLKAAQEHAAVLLEKATLDLERTELYCPDDTDGVIVNDLVEKGDYVRRGTPLVTIEDTAKVEVKCNLRVDELYWLWNQTGLGPGPAREEARTTADHATHGAHAVPADYQIPEAPATVIYRLAGQDYKWDGVLARYDGVGLDESTRTVPCRVVVEAPRDVCATSPDGAPGQCTGPPALVRGMYVTVKIHTKPQASLVRISEAAVRPGNKVWVVRDGKIEILEVHVVETTGNDAIVRAGPLEAGDHVVVTPLAEVRESMAVREQAVQ